VAYRYLKTIMLSLFITNLFPLSFLDGGQVLQATADLVLKDSEKNQDLESGGRGFRSLDGGGRIGRRKILIKNSAEVGTWVLIGTSSTLGLVHWYRS
jgi:membrane-associated protease RseP (regulator of RpoE activity)